MLAMLTTFIDLLASGVWLYGYNRYLPFRTFSIFIFYIFIFYLFIFYHFSLYQN